MQKLEFLNVIKTNNSSRIYGLDIIRATAILLVLLQHSGHFVPLDAFRRSIIYLPDGVTLFFVLSGYLIGDIMIRKFDRATFSILEIFIFLKRRWLRTIPAYYFILSLLIIISFLKGSNLHFQEIANYFTFSQNLWFVNPPFFPEAWSLPIEEWFYLIAPFFLFIMSKMKVPFRHCLISFIILILALSSTVRLYKLHEYPINNFYSLDALFRKQVATRMDSIALGLLGAYLNFYYNNKWVKYKRQLLFIGLAFLLISSLLFLLPLYKMPVYFCGFSFVVTSLCFLCMFPFFSQIRNGRKIPYMFFTFFSLISYSLYLVNNSLVTNTILPYFPISFLPLKLYLMIKFFLFWFLSIFFSVFLYKYIEVPFMNRRSPNIK